MVADDLLPQVSWPGPESQKPVVQGKLRTVRTAGRFAKPTRKHLLRLHFFQNLEVACTCISAEETPTGTVLKRDHARFTALGCDFPVARTDGELIVEVQSDEPFAPSFETRIIETLQFVLARSLALRIMVIAEDAAQGLELASAVPTVGKAKLDPPLAAGYQGFQECFWPLFIRYLEYVVANNNTQYWHSCSYHLNNACEASAHSIDAWATAVCVAVEGISSLVTFEQTAEDEQ